MHISMTRTELLILSLGWGGRICAFSYFSQSISLPLFKGAFLCIPAEIQGVTHPVNQHRRAEWSIFVRTAEVSSHMAKIKNKKGKGWSIFKKKKQKRKSKLGSVAKCHNFKSIYWWIIQPAHRNELCQNGGLNIKNCWWIMDGDKPGQKENVYTSTESN